MEGDGIGGTYVEYCQWINGNPSKRDLRLKGPDAFKCLKTCIGPWCEEHRQIVYRPAESNETKLMKWARKLA